MSTHARVILIELPIGKRGNHQTPTEQPRGEATRTDVQSYSNVPPPPRITSAETTNAAARSAQQPPKPPPPRPRPRPRPRPPPRRHISPPVCLLPAPRSDGNEKPPTDSRAPITSQSIPGSTASPAPTRCTREPGGGGAAAEREEGKDSGWAETGPGKRMGRAGGRAAGGEPSTRAQRKASDQQSEQ